MKRHNPTENPFHSVTQRKEYSRWYYEHVTRGRMGIKGNHRRARPNDGTPPTCLENRKNENGGKVS